MRPGYNNTVDRSPRVTSSCKRKKMSRIASQHENRGFPAIAMKYHKSVSLS